MLHLTIIRHAKSSWDRVDTSDHDRTLNERGFAAAPGIGRWLALEGWSGVGLGIPDSWHSSTATRARLSAEIIAGECGLPLARIQLEHGLYLASGDEILNMIRTIPKAGHVVIFGHNPGLEDLVNGLLDGESVEHFKTAAVACLRLSVQHWSDLTWDSAKLLFHHWPARHK